MRRIGKTGSDTGYISLPKKWLKDNELGWGEYVELEIKSDRIIITGVGLF